MAYRMLIVGSIEKDVRSDDESSEDEDSSSKKKDKKDK